MSSGTDFFIYIIIIIILISPTLTDFYSSNETHILDKAISNRGAIHSSIVLVSVTRVYTVCSGELFPKKSIPW